MEIPNQIKTGNGEQKDEKDLKPPRREPGDELSPEKKNLAGGQLEGLDEEQQEGRMNAVQKTFITKQAVFL